MFHSMMHMIVWTLFITFLIVQYTGNIDAKRCKPKQTLNNDTRPGRCPHPQYAFSGLPCSAEGNDSICPWNYKCCPLTTGLGCFAPCPEWSSPCTLNCTFGLKVDPSPCTTCQCADDPCLTTNCHRGTTCNSIPYTPCSIPDRCGFIGQCVKDTLTNITTIPKPNLCPQYWPYYSSGSPSLATCNGSDADCPLDQKCCSVPIGGDFRSGPDSYENYCSDPCLDVSNCTLSCSFGRKIINFCEVCECIVDACLTITCPPGQQCRMLPAPCFHYPGSPPCQSLPTCY